MIPKAIAYAFLAGIPPIYGLYSCLIPLLVYAVFGTSMHLSIGPVAVTSILFMAGISELATPFSDEFVSLLLITGFVVGLVQILMGILKLGFIVHVLAQPVISGFISAAAIIIIVSQFKSGLAIDFPSGLNTFESILYLFQHIQETHLYTFVITLVSVALMLLVKKWSKNFPTSLVLIVVFTTLSYFLEFKGLGVSIIGDIPNGLPSFKIPEFDFITVKKLVPTIFTLTIIGYLGSIGIAKSFQMKHRNYQVNPNKELIALGLAKIAGTFFQGNLASGSYSRSAINEDAGAQTSLSAIATVFIIALSLLFLTPFLYYLPKPVLAAIILVSVFSLVKVKEAKQYLKIKLYDFIVMIFTFLVTLCVSIEAGILSGVLLSFIFQQYQSSKPHIAELVNIPNSNYYRNIKRFPEGIESNDYLILRFDDQLYFGNADYFKESMYHYLEKRSQLPRFLILHATNIHTIDSTGLHILEDLYNELQDKGVEILFSGMIGPVRDILTRSGFMKKLGASHQFMNITDAVNYIDSNQNKPVANISHVLQFNERRFVLLRKIRVFFKRTIKK